MMGDTTLAIDFGTSNSLVGGWKDGKRIEALAIDTEASDPTLMRTLLYFPHQDLCYYGVNAIHQYIENEMQGRLFRSFKAHLPNRAYLGTYVGHRVVTLEYMIGVFLLELKRRAEKILDSEVERVVIGKPARYSMDEVADGFALHRMHKAAELAGFKHIQFMPEPLAAALDFRRQLKSEKTVLIGDFGGGTSDFTLIRMGPYPFECKHVLGIDGCALAGDALDSLFMSHRLNTYFGAQTHYKMALGSNFLRMPQSIMDRLNHPAQIVHLQDRDTHEFIRQVRQGAISEKDKKAIERLFIMIEDQQIFSFFEQIEKTKRLLSNSDIASFDFTYPGLEIQERFQRSEFSTWAENIHKQIFKSLDECFRQAQVSQQNVDLVCLTGGSAQVPLIRSTFVKLFGEEKLQTQSHFHSVLSGLIEASGMEGAAF